ncbi:MAG: class I SAM-dependent methyltransferase [Phycisphaeraceae bacterium]
MTATQTAEPVKLDTAKSEAFAERMLEMMNGGAVMLMTSLGHRSGLFDTMAALPPSTAGQIAERAGLSERYVREWLGAMTTGRIVEHDPEADTFHLPPEHAAWLTRAASPNNIAATAQFFAVLGSAEDEVLRAFHDGKGVPYSAYPRFHEVMAEESAQTTVAGLFEHILPLAPGLMERLEQGIDALDLGCGRGWALMAMAERFPNSRFVGGDFSEEAIFAAREEAKQHGLNNVTFEVVDAADTPWDEAFDVVFTFDAVHDQGAPDRMLVNIRRALRPGGTYLMQDIGACSHLHGNMDHPMGPYLYTISCMHCMSVSLHGGGRGLGAVWGQQTALKMLGEAGFKDVEVKKLPHDVFNEYFVTGKPRA